MRSSEAALRGDASNSKALKQWQAAQIVSMAAAEAIAFYGVVLQMVLGSPLSQASSFYTIGLLLLLLWRPRYRQQPCQPETMKCSSLGVVITRLSSRKS